jgi:hypothetical protein
MYDPTTIRRLTINPIAETELERVAAAMNGLTGEFGQTWVEVTLYGFDLAEESKRTNVPVDILKDHMTDFEQCVFLWEDLEVIRNLKGFADLQEKLAVCLKNQNVDVEISVAADLCRLKFEVELEPPVDNDKFADSRFRLGLTETGPMWKSPVEMTVVH